MMHRDFFNWAVREWEWDKSMSASLRKFSDKLKAWNKDKFGNVFKQKKRLQLRLEGVQKVLISHTTPAILKLKRRLREERNEVLLQEEIVWQQKAKIDWLKYGDRNTKFFHTATLTRKRRNRIDVLLDKQGAWVEDEKKSKEMACRFYAGLFTSNRDAG